MRQILLFVGFFVAWGSYSQALREINFSYLYNPAETFTFRMHPVKSSQGWDVYFDLLLNDTRSSANRYSIHWEERESLTAREGVPLDSMEVSDFRGRDRFYGKISLSEKQLPVVLVAKVADPQTGQAKFFHKILRPDFPVDGMLVRETAGIPETGSFVYLDQPYTLGEETPVVVTYYNDDFPAASPAFSETMARVSPTIKADSLFTILAGESISFPRQGLYLIQKDTAASLGFSIRAEDDYPKYSTLQSLYAPLIYVTTKPEYERLKTAATNKDKKSFDKVILNITRDTERAKNFMRSYFRRVETANRYFTSYKEGWKTDRGMVYIIFGQPDEVYRFEDREVWKYNNDQHKLTFNFVRSGTLFDPDNYVLIRDKKHQRIWYETVDLWRNARF